MSSETEPRTTEGGLGPRSVLILSAEMGEGHNAAARALTEAMAEVWPECRVDQFDTVQLRGMRFAALARWSYGFQLSFLPRSYEVFYDTLSRSDRFAALSKSAIGWFFGRRLERLLAERDDDLVISTYPFGSAALDWMVRRRGLRIPTVTYIPAFHVHPLWGYSTIDRHFVMYDTAPEHARTPGFGASMRLGAPPVQRRFGTISRSSARHGLAIDPDAFVVLVTGGAWGLGGISEAVGALVDLEPAVVVVAVCGKNQALVGQLEGLRRPDRLKVLGYVDTMPELMAAANVVVTNGAGVTVLEALRTPRPTVAFQPLAGHGVASTTEMVRRNLAVPAADVPELVEWVRRLRTDNTLLRRMEQAVERWSDGRSMTSTVAEIGELIPDRRRSAG